ncbi:MAG: phytanoyl-CoA dioxygenase family protein, partial [Pseudomonadota bacterium]|nr:phytanoyl-CoA dioxygenase family protein [Pseudomonadota bacterium]
MMLALDDAQLKQFDGEGWLFFEDVFNADEVALLNREARRIFAMDRQEVFREKDGTTARTAFAAQNYNDVYHRLGRHPRLVNPVKQLLGGDVYMHQFKINAKAAFNGDVWQWHQDFGTWHR